MSRRPFARRRVTRAVASAFALAAMIAVLVAPGAGASQTASAPSSHSATPRLTPKALAFHDRMRALWEAHGSGTRMVIISFVGNLPNLQAQEQTLLRNQVDIGNAVKPYYGRKAGNRLTQLLREHILGAVTVLVAAKSGDKNQLAQAEAAWSANGRQIADFLHRANPRFLSRSAARTMMQVHLQQVIEQAVDELSGNYAASANAFEPYIRHILAMADMISGGIIRQFPNRFR
jgi:hypothetical protein